MKLADFKLTAADFGALGAGLQRPECVWTDADGIWVSDARGGLAQLAPDGTALLLGSGIREPNGFSRRPDGSFVVAGIGDGALHWVSPQGQTRVLRNTIDGLPLGAVNFACADGADRIWLSVMTRGLPWHSALSARHVDGYIVRVEDQGDRCTIVADGLDLTNEVKRSPDGHHLYAVETFASRVVRFVIRRDGSLGNKESVGPPSLGSGVLPDGITFDAWGNVWVTVINQNALYVIDRHHDVHVVYCDPNPRAVAAVTEAVRLRNGNVDQLAVCAQVSGPLRLPTSVAFGGPDARTGYVGAVAQSYLATFRLPERLE